MRNKTALAQPHCAPCMMAAGVVRAAIASILLDKDFELNTPRMVVAKETAQMLLDVSTGMIWAKTGLTTLNTYLYCC